MLKIIISYKNSTDQITLHTSAINVIFIYLNALSMMHIVSKEEKIIVPNVHGHFCNSMNSDVIMLFRKFIIDQNTYIDPPLSQNFPCRRAIFFSRSIAIVLSYFIFRMLVCICISCKAIWQKLNVCVGFVNNPVCNTSYTTDICLITMYTMYTNEHYC